jgi:hypothetical protein
MPQLRVTQPPHHQQGGYQSDHTCASEKELWTILLHDHASLKCRYLIDFRQNGNKFCQNLFLPFPTSTARTF